MSRPTVVVDKCFLQGSKADRIRDLCRTHDVLMTDVLFYELISSSEPQRSRCFAKFPSTENPVTWVKNSLALRRKEIEHRTPSGKPSENPAVSGYRFHPDLSTGNYVPPDGTARALDEENRRVRADVASFIQSAQVMATVFPDLLSDINSPKENAIEEAAHSIATEPSSVITFYAELNSEPGERPFPPADLVTPSWALFRYLQVQLLMALDIYSRYRGKIPNVADLTPAWYEKIEHDLHDAEYLVLGVLEGSFATNELKLQRYWKMLRPDGVLLS